jgi:hypothetical protein
MNFIFFVLVAIFAAAYAGTAAVAPAALKEGSTGNCGGNCPGGCSSCPCGSSTNYQDISHWCSQHSWNQVRLWKTYYSISDFF